MATDTTGSDASQQRLESLTTLAVGAVLVVVGLVAPVVAGPEGEFIVFGRNYLHDAIHLLTGLVALVAGYYAGGRYAKLSAQVLGAVYLLVAVLGVVFLDVFRELIALNVADNALHLLLAVVLLGVGIVFGIAGE